MCVRPFFAHYISMTPAEYITLFEKYQDGLCSPDEEALLMQYRDRFHLQEEDHPELPAVPDEAGARIYSRLAELTGPTRVKRFNWGWAAAAAVAGLVISLGVLYLREQPQHGLAVKQPAAVQQTPNKPIKPGTNTATLTLANGKVITLNDAPEGVLAQTGQTAITKGNGQLSYAAANKTAVTENVMNTMTVPRGGQYAVTLSDGTRVWLNSQSSLTYPEVFTGPERKVVLSGEAYFEVSQNEQQPFTVQTDRATVHVLGTSFNMSAYADETSLKATLVQGAIRLSDASASTLLAPGEQGLINKGLTGIQKKRVNIEQEIAWKAGYFVFRNSSIQDIMRQVSRWYDVEVEYRGQPPIGTFGGTYSKNKDILELLKGLELTGLIHFTIEGRKVIVTT